MSERLSGPMVCGIFLDQELNQSLVIGKGILNQLGQQGSPILSFKPAFSLSSFTLSKSRSFWLIHDLNFVLTSKACLAYPKDMLVLL